MKYRLVYEDYLLSLIVSLCDSLFKGLPDLLVLEI